MNTHFGAFYKSPVQSELEQDSESDLDQFDETMKHVT